MKKIVKVYSTLLAMLMMLVSFQVSAAPQKVLLPEWKAFDAKSTQVVDHSAWQSLLSKYVRTRSGINLFNYAAVSNQDKQALNKYLSQLQSVNPKTLNRAEQFAYWANLYNSKTVDLILENYPVSSIKKIGSIISGPWDKKYLKVNGKSLSLNNIEHGILRPIYNDSRIHYVLNCASIGCPNLSKKALTASNYKSVLSQSARDFVNHSRAVKFTGEKLELSSIYDWYGSDFGSNDKAKLKSISRYANADLKKKLLSYSGKISYQYNWDLNKL